jgi:two-component SAPR family response regulator
VKLTNTNMSKTDPIIIVSNSHTILFELIIKDLTLKNKIIYFIHPQNALNYILSESPFLIFYDINTFALTGINLKQEINECLELSKKNTPLIFYSTSSNQETTDKAYLKMLVLNFL